MFFTKLAYKDDSKEKYRFALLNDDEETTPHPVGRVQAFALQIPMLPHKDGSLISSFSVRHSAANRKALPNTSTALDFTNLWFWTALCVLTVARTWIALCLEITPAEALFALRSAPEHWALVDGGGGGLALCLLKVPWDGWDSQTTVLGVRWSGPLLGLLISLQLWHLMRRLRLDHGLWAVLLLNFLPVFNYQTVQFSPLLVVSSLGLLGIHCFAAGLHQSIRWPVHFALAGIVWGLATLCHGVGVVFMLAAVGFLATSRRWRRHLWTRGGLILLLDYLAVGILPYLWWNADHHQLGWPLWWAEIRVQVPLKSWGRQLVLAISPGVALGITWFSYQIGNQRKQVFSILWFIAALLLSHRAGLLPILTTIGLALLPILVVGFVLLLRKPKFTSTNRGELVCRISLGLAAATTLFLASPSPLGLKGIPTQGWQTATGELDALLTEWQAKVATSKTAATLPVVLCNTPELAAILQRHLPSNAACFRATLAHPTVQVIQGQAADSLFSFWPRYDDATSEQEYRGRRVIFIKDVPVGLPRPAETSPSPSEVPILTWEINTPSGPIRRLEATEIGGFELPGL